MKHFEVITTIGSTNFVHKCTTAYEALTAIVDVLAAHHSSEDADGAMKILVEMKNGSVLLHETHLYRVRYIDGEV